ncbi:MAG: acyl-CoA dehydrogenase family protein [Deltaproteobacteria bacterium]|nr:acyl-CoA dehydrogenase family protein [Deltaproteobacteria bacterium]
MLAVSRPPPPSPYYTVEHDAFRTTLRGFVSREIAPYAEAWDEAKTFPRELYRKAGEVGLLGLSFPEEHGGTPADPFYAIIACEELARPGAGGISASLMSHTIAVPPIARLGSRALQAKVIPSTLRGETIAALAITEPSGGSDVASLRTTARRDGDFFVVNGSKTFITSGIRADFYTVAVRTGGEGMGGISLLLIEKGTPGFSATPLEKMGWWASDTATLYFDGCRVPAANLIGEENQGFLGLMLNFNSERLGLAANACAFAQVCYEEAVAWAQERVTFGRPLITRQVIRHKLIDMRMRIESTKAFLESVAWLVMQGESPVPEICMLKNHAVECLEHCAGEAVQILGGAGYIRGAKCERIYRETKVLAIGGGASEIMKDLAARQLGW